MSHIRTYEEAAKQVGDYQEVTSTRDATIDKNQLDVYPRNDSSDPLNVVEVFGTGTHDFDQVASLAKSTSDNHDVSIASGIVFNLKKVQCSSSGDGTFELQIGDGAASEVFTTRSLVYSSDDDQNPKIELDPPIQVTGTVNTTTIRVIRTNNDNQAIDMQSTIMGNE